MKFKLIKRYPGCNLNLGDIVSDEYGLTFEFGYENSNGIIDIFKSSNITDYPEFWEEVVELDYEILSFGFKNDVQGDLQYGYDRILLDDGFYHKDGIKEKVPSRLDALLKNCKNTGYYIKSIKRLSDGEVFTMNDKVDAFDLGNSTISSIRIDNGKAKIGIRHCGIIELRCCQKAKTPLFTTEDGVDLFKGDEYYQISNKFESIKCKAYDENNFCESLIIFSTKDAAEKYISENKPQYTQKDMIKFGTDCSVTGCQANTEARFKTWKNNIAKAKNNV